MSKTTYPHHFSVRLSDEQLDAIESFAMALRQRHPQSSWSRNDAIRLLIDAGLTHVDEALEGAA